MILSYSRLIGLQIVLTERALRTTDNKLSAQGSVKLQKGNYKIGLNSFVSVLYFIRRLWVEYYQILSEVS